MAKDLIGASEIMLMMQITSRGGGGVVLMMQFKQIN